MVLKSSTFRTLLTAVFITASALANTAQGQDHLFSLTFNSGVNFGDLSSSSGFSVMQSYLNTSTLNTFTIGTGVQFEPTPIWTLEAGYKYSKILGEAGGFETNVNTVSFKNMINLDRIFASAKLLSIVNPYLSAGVGYDFYSFDSFSSPSESFNDKSISYNIGLGLAVKVTRSIELFSHYEYHVASNTIDNVNTGFEADFLNTLTGGLRINFFSGRKRASRSTVQPPPVEATPVAETIPLVVEDSPEVETPLVMEDSPVVETYTSVEDSSAEYNEFASILRKIEHLEEDVNHLEQRIEEHELVQRVENMEILLQEVRSKLDNIPDEPAVENGSGLAKSVPRGTYVQIFASDRLSLAREVRDEAISVLENRLKGTSEQVVITRRDNFYQVLIGGLSDKGKAASIKSIMSDQYSDAFIISFPRPLSLQADYSDIQIVE